MFLNNLWVEKYRPKTLNDYVFRDETLRTQLTEFVNKQTISQHLLFLGSAGTGKSTAAKILMNQLNVEESDILIANGSKECRKIEWIDKLIGFCQTMPFGQFKVVYIDEFDGAGAHVQDALRNLMEEYHATVRFIATGNYYHKIIPALQSRFQVIKIDKLDDVEYTARVATILVEENIEFELEILDTFVKAAYPDLRKCINNIQQHSVTGRLELPISANASADYKIEMVALFKAGKILEARQLICANAVPEDYVELYRWIYDNLDILSTNQDVQDKIILYVKQGLVDHVVCADPEINFSATMVRIMQAL